MSNEEEEWQSSVTGPLQERNEDEYGNPLPNSRNTFSYDNELAPGYFVMANSDFMRDGEVSCTAKVLYLVLASYCGQGTNAWPGKETLREHCGGISEPTLTKAIRELESCGLLVTKRRGQGLSNIYHLHKLPTAPAKKSLDGHRRWTGIARDLKF